jgi:hypothetical protein
VSRGESYGPAGVLLELKKAGSDELVQQTNSLQDGGFTFERVLPGDYIVKASRPPWLFDVVCVHC